MRQLITTGNETVSYNRELQQGITTGNETVNYNRELQQGMKQLVITGNYNREWTLGLFSLCDYIYSCTVWNLYFWSTNPIILYFFVKPASTVIPTKPNFLEIIIYSVF